MSGPGRRGHAFGGRDHPRRLLISCIVLRVLGTIPHSLGWAVTIVSRGRPLPGPYRASGLSGNQRVSMCHDPLHRLGCRYSGSWHVPRPAEICRAPAPAAYAPAGAHGRVLGNSAAGGAVLGPITLQRRRCAIGRAAAVVVEPAAGVGYQAIEQLARGRRQVGTSSRSSALCATRASARTRLGPRGARCGVGDSERGSLGTRE